MSKFDVLYLDLCDDILTHGFREKGRNGYTFRIPGRHWVIDLGEEFPILTSKKTAWKSAVREMYWIWKENSIDVRWLQERGIHIWDKFEIDEDGYYTNPDTGEVKFFGEEYAHTIGTSYGYIIANGGEPNKPNQIIEAIRKIKEEFKENNEYQITSVLEEIRNEKGINAFIPNGSMLDLGNVNSYKNSFIEYNK